MDTTVQHMTGHELLLLRVLGAAEVGDVVERELDRRALFGPPPSRRARRPYNPARAAGRLDGLLVA